MKRQRVCLWQLGFISWSRDKFVFPIERISDIIFLLIWYTNQGTININISRLLQLKTIITFPMIKRQWYTSWFYNGIVLSRLWKSIITFDPKSAFLENTFFSKRRCSISLKRVEGTRCTRCSSIMNNIYCTLCTFPCYTKYKNYKLRMSRERRVFRT